MYFTVERREQEDKIDGQYLSLKDSTNQKTNRMKRVNTCGLFSSYFAWCGINRKSLQKNPFEREIIWYRMVLDPQGVFSSMFGTQDLMTLESHRS